jgi:hypothetical protein
MAYREHFSKLDLAIPAAQALLGGASHLPTHHLARGARSPVAAYNVSVDNVVRRLLKVAQLVDEGQRDGIFAHDEPEAKSADLLDATDHMLDALVEHIEDCGSIIQSFFPVDERKRSEQAVARFKKSVLEYRDHVATIVNYMKHSQGRLRLVVMTTDAISTLGYYVEGVTRSGGIGPVGTVHPNENSAFSYNRDLPFHACQIFLVGVKLAEALTTIDPRLHAGNGSEISNTKLGALLPLVSALPKIYFPDELLKDQPYLGVNGQGVVLEFPSQRVHPATHGRMKVKALFMTDGATKEFSVPYLGQSEMNKTFTLLQQRRPFVRLLL